MDNYVIAISRGYGSGGKYIATKLAEKLKIPLLDRELLKMASMESGISEEIFNLSDEKIRKKLFTNYSRKLYQGGVLSPEDSRFTSDINLFNYQAKVLLNMSRKESFVVLGRAGFYILRNMPNVISINVQAPMEDCVESVMNREGLSMKDAAKKVKSINRYRDDYIKAYTGLPWWDMSYYDLALNTSRLDRDQCVDMITDFAGRKLGIQL
ncbi:MAG: cytidylate kinase-like family protein [Lachnospiraceae bacterium]|nr:cytidylate kinase-like family protein [Lachnospiraceae bacterium]